MLLLNIPPDRRGRICPVDAARLRELRKVLDATFRTDLARGARAVADSAAPGHGAEALVDGDESTWWAPAGGGDGAGMRVELDLGGQRAFNVVMLREFIPEGQHVEKFKVEVPVAGGWREITAGTTIGYQRLLILKPDVRARRVRLTVLSSRGAPRLCRFGLFHAPVLPP